MQKSIETTGISRDAAIEVALRELSLDRDSVSVEVLDNGSKGFMGIGSKPVRVRVTYEVPEEVEKILHRPVEKREEPVRQERVSPERSARPETMDGDRISPKDPRRMEPRLVKSADQNEEQKDKPIERQTERNDRFARSPRNDRAPRREPVKEVHEEKPVIPVSPEAMEKATAEAIRFIKGLLQEMHIEGDVKVLEQTVADQLRLEICGPDMGPVIGRRGDTLDAIQYLTSLVMTHVTDEHIRISIDAENYRGKRAESLERLAQKMANKVLRYHKAMTLEPMNPYERRIIHASLQNFRGVTTYSTGSEPGRRVVIAPEGSGRYRNQNPS